MNAARESQLGMLVSGFIGEGVAHGFRLGEIEAASAAQRARRQERLSAQPSSDMLPRARLVGKGSQDLCLDILMNRFRHVQTGRPLYYAPVGSLPGLMAPAAGETHFAAAHVYDSQTDDHNMPSVLRLLPG